VEGLWHFGVSDPFAFISNKSINLVPRGGWFIYIDSFGSHFKQSLDISWRELKQILHYHEEISEENCSTLFWLSYKVGNLEQSFTHHIESFVIECQFLRTLIIPHPIHSLSIYQVFLASHNGI
jgi:hypothetical protein